MKVGVYDDDICGNHGVVAYFNAALGGQGRAIEADMPAQGNESPRKHGKLRPAELRNGGAAWLGHQMEIVPNRHTPALHQLQGKSAPDFGVAAYCKTWIRLFEEPKVARTPKPRQAINVDAAVKSS